MASTLRSFTSRNESPSNDRNWQPISRLNQPNWAALTTRRLMDPLVVSCALLAATPFGLISTES
jgi:hypothetical protein